MIRIPDKLMVCLPADASTTIQSAFHELAADLKESANIMCENTVDTPLTTFHISLGNTAALKQAGISQPVGWKDDSFGAVVKDNVLFIHGKTDRAVLYGVYEFLEDVVGVRFLSPQETYIPAHPEGISISKNYIHKNLGSMFFQRSICQIYRSLSKNTI